MIKFYDTNGLLHLLEKVLDEDFVISSKTLEEIEHIKVSDRKDQDVKYRARKIAHLLDDNKSRFKVVIPDSGTAKILKKFQLEATPDNIIMACAYDYNKNVEPIKFISDDICCKITARNLLGLEVESVNENKEVDYTGFKEVCLSDDKIAYLYEHPSENTYDLLINEYLIIRNKKNEIIDKFRWNGEDYTSVKFGAIKSEYFGTVKAYSGDVYQQCALNCLDNCKITMLKGSAGTGKSYLALGHLFYLLEKHKIEKIIVFCNPVGTLNSARIGYLPGDKNEKILASSIGNMLASKLGGLFAINQLIDDNKLELLPISDIRGYDTSNMKAGIYITEAQNMDISLMKLALQRIGEDCVCIIDGDYKCQVDMYQYAGNNNGMKRASEVFRGNSIYGEIELQNIYRSAIAKIAELM